MAEEGYEDYTEVHLDDINVGDSGDWGRNLFSGFVSVRSVSQGTVGETGLIATGSVLNKNGVQYARINVSGTTKKAGTFYFTVIFMKGQIIGNYDNRVEKRYIVYITVKGIDPPVITTESLPGGKSGVEYSAAVEATGTMPITWSVTAGSLPPGLSLDADTGVISGTPT